MKEKFESNFEQTGNLFEWQFIGEVNTSNPEYQKALSKLQIEEIMEGTIGGYINYERALELAKKFQPFDPTNPNKPFARDVRISLLDLMIGKGWIKENEEDQDRVKFYTAVGTPLDKLHSADAFIEYEDRNGKNYLVTFDLTLNPGKEIGKSDVIVSELPDPDLEEEKKKYLEAVERYAREALIKIKLKKIREEKEKGY